MRNAFPGLRITLLLKHLTVSQDRVFNLRLTLKRNRDIPLCRCTALTNYPLINRGETAKLSFRTSELMASRFATDFVQSVANFELSSFRARLISRWIDSICCTRGYWFVVFEQA